MIPAFTSVAAVTAEPDASYVSVSAAKPSISVPSTVIPERAADELYSIFPAKVIISASVSATQLSPDVPFR